MPGDSGLHSSRTGDISSIFWMFLFIESLIFFLFFLQTKSSESVLLTRLSVGDVSSSRNKSSTDAVIWANLLPISMESARSQELGALLKEMLRSTESVVSSSLAGES